MIGIELCRNDLKKGSFRVCDATELDRVYEFCKIFLICYIVGMMLNHQRNCQLNTTLEDLHKMYSVLHKYIIPSTLIHLIVANRQIYLYIHRICR